jgi:DNA-binding CsgD family transcriptional regulator
VNPPGPRKYLRPVETLTPRERDVCRLVATGLRNADVALYLGIGESAVRNTLMRAFDKIGVSNRTELALYVVDYPLTVAVLRHGERREEGAA